MSSPRITTASRWIGVVLTLSIMPVAARAADESKKKQATAGPAVKVSYDKQIRPILQAHCQGCHQPAKAGGAYVMTAFDRMLKGGESGVAAIVPGLVSLIVLPLVIYWIWPPKLKRTENATALAREKLEEMGPVSAHEWIMLGVFVLLLVLWIFGGELGLDATAAAFVGLGVLLLSGVLSWEDILKERGARHFLDADFGGVGHKDLISAR